MQSRIYVDFDDVVCETARPLCDLLNRLFGRHVPYEDVVVFDLEQAFGLTPEQYDLMMERAHEEAFLAALPPTPGAVETLQGWLADGLAPEIVTGRPADSGGISRCWLARWGLEALSLAHVDKYGRHPDVSCPPGESLWTADLLHRQAFAVAIDDSPLALDLLGAANDYPVLIFDRPWNVGYSPANGQADRFLRCRDWGDVDRAVRSLA